MTTPQELRNYEQAALASFDAVVGRIATGPDMAREAARLEGQIEQLHNVAVVTARQSDDADEIAAIWLTMVQTCEDSLLRLTSLARAHPGAPIAPDKLLDLLSDCRERHAFHA